MTMTIPLKTDAYGRQVFSEDDVVQLLYENPQLDIHNLDIQDVQSYNTACELLHIRDKLAELSQPEGSPEEFHAACQAQWHMPAEYVNWDVAKWCLDQCENDQQLQRVGKELLMFQERGLMDLLKFLKYFVDTLRENGVVWGVGRGSSVASYVLYLLGVHKIDSLYYDLDVEEFLR